MDLKKIKRNIYIIKIIVFAIFTFLIFYTIYKKPEIPKHLKENYYEVNLKTYGGNSAEKAWNSLFYTNFLYILADTRSFGIGGTDIYLLKLNKSLELLNAQTFGYIGNDTGISIIISDDRFIYIAGGTDFDGVSSSDICVLKCTLDGEKVWIKTFGTDNFDFAYDIVQDKNDFIICGYSSSQEKNSDIYIIKIDKNGNLIWEKSYGFEKWEVAYNIIKLKEGNFLLTGYTNSIGNGKSDILLLKIDSNGNSLWTKTFGGLRDDIGISALQKNNGNILVSGNSSSYISRGFGLDIIIFEIDSKGNSLWTKIFPATQLEVGFELKQDSNGDIFLAGTKKCYGICNANIFLAKLNQYGDTKWFRIFTTKNNSFASNIEIVSNNYFLIGTTTSLDIKGDIFASIIDFNGNFFK